MFGSKKIATFVAAILSLCLVGMLTFQGAQMAQADPLDLTKGSCSVSVGLAEGDGDDVIVANLNLDYKLYKVADAERTPGYEGYTFAPITSGSDAQFPGLFGDIQDLNSTITAGTSASDQPTATQAYQKLAQKAAGLVAADGSTIRPQYTASASSPLDNVDPGLYLMVAYGANLTGSELIKQNDTYVSKAESSTQEFTFLPEMIALPMQSVSGGWTSNVTIELKYETSPLPGTLEITKVLSDFEQNNQFVGTNGATFIFSIKGYESEAAYKSDPGSFVYSNVASVDFDAIGVKTIAVSDVPVGLFVVVEEVYEGATYKNVSDSDEPETATIESAATPARVTFTNTFKQGAGNGNSGGAIIFSFEKAQSGDWIKNDPVIIDHSQNEPEGGE